ncbi:hypothetical protein HYX70_04710 [Candidatus Saccharibacteria bacterium]|nr:hypothetical protein [Candidatus Saccharibacteria bacterium]
MNLKDFVKDVLTQINAAVDEARTETSRDIQFSEKDNARTIEFDIAVSAEHSDKKSGKAGIKVLEFIEGGGDISKENKNATVSRVVFGLKINYWTKEEEEKNRQAVERHNAQAGNNFL